MTTASERPRRRRWSVPGIVVAAALVAGAGVPFLARARAGAQEQPIAFNHKLHMAQDMECTTCHEGADSAAHARLPGNDVCMGCHNDPLGKSAEEPRVRELAAKKREIPWARMNRLVGHVYFSHRAHVKWGKIECEACHGDMRSATTPVRSSQIGRLTMSTCIACHRQMQARTDCLTCHK